MTITGRVGGDVVVLDGVLTIGSGARVVGDVYADQRVVDPDATLEGATYPIDRLAWAFEWTALAAAFAVWLAVAVSVLILGLVLLALAPRAADATYLTARSAVGTAIAAGLVGVFGLPIVAVLAIGTLVGIRLGLGLLLGFAMILAVGQVTAVWILGRAIVRAGSRYAAFLAGWAIVATVALIPFVGGIVWLAASVYGLGAITVAVWRVRRAPAHAPVPPAPPVPAGA